MKLHPSAIAALLALSAIAPGHALDNIDTADTGGHRMNGGGDHSVLLSGKSSTAEDTAGTLLRRRRPGLRKTLAGVGKSLFSSASSSAMRRKKHMSATGVEEMQQASSATASADHHDPWNEIVDEAALGGTEDQRDLVEDLSSWDGWRFVKPSTDPNGCSDGVNVVDCLSVSDDETILWMHDDKGRLIRERDPGLCLGYSQVDSDYTPDFQACQDGVDAQVWTRTPSGQLLNKAINKVLVKKVCGQALSPLVLLDDLDVPEDGCDLWAVVGPNYHDPDDHGSAYFTPIGDKIVPNQDSTDYTFASSVAMNDAGNIVVIGGTATFNEGSSFLGVVDTYERNGNSWTRKSSLLHPSEYTVRPKVEVTINGDGDRVAMAIVGTKDSGVIEVYSIDSDFFFNSLGQIETKSSGELPGVKLAMDKTGSTLLVGEPYYDLEDGTAKNAGRVRTFNLLDLNLAEIEVEVGTNTDDRVGSAVSINGDGDLIAYGSAGHSTDDKGLVSVLKLINGLWESFANDIFGVEENDEAGSSIKIVDDGSTVHLAVGAVYNDGNGQINSGHVRVFSCDSSNCQAWAQVGSDIDGDHGVVFDGDSFHVGDAFGFSLDMSEKGDMIVIGAPFYSASRASDYYSGNAKLFALKSNEWEQVGHDLTGATNQENSGYSVGLSKDGKTLVIGSPGLGPGSPQGSAQVFYQVEVSNSPSQVPSASPSDTISEKPSASPSKAPSVSPSTSPSKAPSTSPSQAPTSFVGRLFEIRSTYERFGKVVQSDEDWCIEADMDAPFSKLNMRPCDGSARQLWFQDINGKILLREGKLGITYEGKKLELRGVGMANTFDINETEKSISTTKSGGKFLIGIDPSKLFSRLRLYKEGGDNKSVYTWNIEFFGPSDNPTMAPTLSAMPTMAPSTSVCTKSECQWKRFGQQIEGVLTYHLGEYFDVNEDGTRICAGYPQVKVNGKDNAGVARVYDLIGDSWVVSGEWEGQDWQGNFGTSCALSEGTGNSVVFSSPSYIHGGYAKGYLKVFDYDGSNWNQRGDTFINPDTDANDGWIGYSLALKANGSKVVYGRFNANFSTGYVRVYEVTDTQWNQVGSDMTGTAPKDGLGAMLDASEDGNRIVTGSAYSLHFCPDGNTECYKMGMARVFEYKDGAWNQLGQLIGPLINGEYLDRAGFGGSVTMSAAGNRIAVGANSANQGTGFVRAYDFDNDAGEWKQKGQTIFGAGTTSNCGHHVSLSSDGTRLMVGEKGYNYAFGRVRIFDLVDDEWVLKGTQIEGVHENGNPNLGHRAGMSGDGERVVLSYQYHTLRVYEFGQV